MLIQISGERMRCSNDKRRARRHAYVSANFNRARGRFISRTQLNRMIRCCYTWI